MGERTCRCQRLAGSRLQGETLPVIDACLTAPGNPSLLSIFRQQPIQWDASSAVHEIAHEVSGISSDTSIAIALPDQRASLAAINLLYKSSKVFRRLMSDRGVPASKKVVPPGSGHGGLHAQPTYTTSGMAAPRSGRLRLQQVQIPPEVIPQTFLWLCAQVGLTLAARRAHVDIRAFEGQRWQSKSEWQRGALEGISWPPVDVQSDGTSTISWNLCFAFKIEVLPLANLMHPDRRVTRRTPLNRNLQTAAPPILRTRLRSRTLFW